MPTRTIPAEKFEEWMKQVVQKTDRPKAKPALQQTTDNLAGELGVGFLRSEAPDGTKWPPLKRKRPPGHNPGHRPLIDTGAMMQSIVSGGQDHIERVTDDEIVFGSGTDYLIYHQEGTDVIPARPSVGWPDSVVDEAAELIADRMVEQLDF